MALVAGTSEAGAGLLLALGLLTPLASAAVIGTLVVAGSVHWQAGLWVQKGGYELAFFYVTAATALALSGPGKYSLDNAIGLHGFAGNVWGVAAVAAGTLSGLSVITRGRHALAVDAIANKVVSADA